MLQAFPLLWLLSNIEVYQGGTSKQNSSLLIHSIACRVSQLLFDAHQLVILGRAVAAAHGAGLDLSGIDGHGDIGDGGVFGLARTVADDGGVAVATCQLDGVEGLGERAYLIDLYQYAIGAIALDALAEVLDIGDEEVVAHKLAAVADALGEHGPSLPVVLAHAIFDGVDGVGVDEVLQLVDLLLGGARVSLRTLEEGVVIHAIPMVFRCSAVERQGDVYSRGIACRLDGLDEHIQGLLGALECGGEASLIAYACAIASLLEHVLQGAEHFGTHLHGLAYGAGSLGAYHKLLERDRGIGVAASIEEVHHGDGQHMGIDTTYVAVEWHATGLGSCTCYGQRHTQYGIGAEVALGRRTIKFEHQTV